MIESGTLVGGRYLVHGERPVDPDGVRSWWAQDRQLRRRVAILLVHGAAGGTDRRPTVPPRYAGRLLDGGEHEGQAYAVLRVEPLPGGSAPDPTALAPDATTVALAPTDGADATAMLPLPVLAPEPPAPVPPPRQGVSSNRTLVRTGALVVASFVLGAGGMLAAVVVASPKEPAVPTDIAGEGTPAAGQGQPIRTLPTLPSTTTSTTIAPGGLPPFFRWRTTTTEPDRATTTRRRGRKPNQNE